MRPGDAHLRTVWMLKAFWLEAVGTMGHSYSLFHFLIKVNSADLYRNSTWCWFSRQTDAICSFQGSLYWNQKVYWFLSVLLKHDKMLETILITAQTQQSKVFVFFLNKGFINSLFTVTSKKKLNLDWATEVQFNTWRISQTALQASLTHSNCMTSAL